MLSYQCLTSCGVVGKIHIQYDVLQWTSVWSWVSASKPCSSSCKKPRMLTAWLCLHRAQPLEKEMEEIKVTVELAGADRGRVFFVEVNEEETEAVAATAVTKRMLCLHNSLWVQLYFICSSCWSNTVQARMFSALANVVPPKGRAGSASFCTKRTQYCGRKE